MIVVEELRWKEGGWGDVGKECNVLVRIDTSGKSVVLHG